MVPPIQPQYKPYMDQATLLNPEVQPLKVEEFRGSAA